jgi:hypothetical protein
LCPQFCELNEWTPLDAEIGNDPQHGEAKPFQPSDVRPVTGIDVIAQERIVVMQLVQPDRAIPQDLSLVFEDVIGRDHPDCPEVGVLVDRIDTEEANALPRSIYEGPGRTSATNGIRKE